MDGGVARVMFYTDDVAKGQGWQGNTRTLPGWLRVRLEATLDRRQLASFPSEYRGVRCV